jgi:pimeloyl-[acyl-carrier protein] methyl ester esterase
MSVQNGVVLISGWSTASSVWDTVLAPLGDIPVVRVDWWDGLLDPEQALRQAAATVNARANNPIGTPVILVGWSLGGQIALSAADMAPELVQNLILVSTPVRLLADETGVGTDPAALRAMRQGLRRNTDLILKNFWAEATAGDRTGFDISEVFDAIIADVDSKTLDKGLAALGDTDLRSRLPHIQPPAIVLQGDDDRIIGPQAAQQLHDGLPHANAMVINGASHALPLTHPNVITEVLQAVLASQTGDGEAAL